MDKKAPVQQLLIAIPGKHAAPPRQVLEYAATLAGGHPMTHKALPGAEHPESVLFYYGDWSGWSFYW